MLQRLSCLLLLLFAAVGSVRAQYEFSAWRFGQHTSLDFAAIPGSGPPLVSAPHAMNTLESCASIADSAGNLLCYANGEQVWDRLNRPMPNGGLSGSSFSSSQGTLLLQHPGRRGYYSLFTVDAMENGLRGGLRHSIINMALQGGYGDVLAPNSVPVPLPGSHVLSESLTAVRHANSTDYWVIVHGWETDEFLCYHSSAAGLNPVPVRNRIGSVHGPNGEAGAFPAAGALRGSPNGRLLAATVAGLGVEVFDFDNATGRISNPRAARVTVPSPYGVAPYGLEFSPSGARLYMTALERGLYQVDIENGMRTLLISPGGTALQRAPNGIIYKASGGGNFLGYLQWPDSAGLACRHRYFSFPINQTAVLFGLPNFPNQPLLPVSLYSAGDICAGEVATFSTAGLAGATGSPQWRFGDPASGAANTAAGASVSHRYLQPGLYTVQLRISRGGQLTEASTTLRVMERPRLRLLPPAPVVCSDSGAWLRTAPLPAGTTNRWQDGSTGPSLRVNGPGRYTLEVRGPTGCVARDSVVIASVTVLTPPRRPLLPPDTLVCSPVNMWLRALPQPAGTTYLWREDGSAGESLRLRRPGRYTLEVRSPDGCLVVDTIAVTSQFCPVITPTITIPNIITPNGDAQNEAFVLMGLRAPEWSLRIYNRWGQEVYTRAAYDNTWAAQGRPDGLYYYLLTQAATGRQLNGWVEVVR